MNYKKIIFLTPCLMTLLAGCVGGDGTNTISANDLNDGEVKNLYRDLHVTVDENASSARPQYVLYASRDAFATAAKTVKDLQVTVTNPTSQSIPLAEKDDEFDPTRAPNETQPFKAVAAYFAEDSNTDFDNANQIHFGYSVQKTNSSIAPVTAAFNNDEAVQKVEITGLDCNWNGTSCTLSVDNNIPANSNINYQLVFTLPDIQSSDTNCNLAPVSLNEELATSKVFAIQLPHKVNAIAACNINNSYNVKIVAIKQITQDHDRLDFAYTTKNHSMNVLAAQ